VVDEPETTEPGAARRVEHDVDVAVHDALSKNSMVLVLDPKERYGVHDRGDGRVPGGDQEGRRRGEAGGAGDACRRDPLRQQGVVE
jgi:hypothetical protein